MAEQGKANRAVVQGLINDMNAFHEHVTSEIQKMKSKTSALSNAWRDAQYEQFSAFMEELCSAMKSDLEVIQESAAFLQNKLSLYQ